MGNSTKLKAHRCKNSQGWVLEAGGLQQGEPFHCKACPSALLSDTLRLGRTCTIHIPPAASVPLPQATLPLRQHHSGQHKLVHLVSPLLLITFLSYIYLYNCLLPWQVMSRVLLCKVKEHTMALIGFPEETPQEFHVKEADITCWL